MAVCLIAGPSFAKKDCEVTICHIPPGNPDNPQTIVVSENALEAHLDHGDSIGGCVECIDGSNWATFPPDQTFIMDGYNGQYGSYEDRSYFIGSEVLNTSYGLVDCTKVRTDRYVNNILREYRVYWVAFVDNKFMLFKNTEEIIGNLPEVDENDLILLDFPLCQGKTWFNGVDPSGEEGYSTVESTNETLSLPIGKLEGVIKIGSTADVYDVLYWHPDYPFDVKWEFPGTEEFEELREIVDPNAPIKPAMGFKRAMLKDKVYVFSDERGNWIFEFDANGTGDFYSEQFSPYFLDTFTATWSIDKNGKLFIDEPEPPGRDSIVTLISDTATYMDVLVDVGTEVTTERWKKVIPFDVCTLPGTYFITREHHPSYHATATLYTDGTGKAWPEDCPENCHWIPLIWWVDTAGVLYVENTEIGEPSPSLNTIYLLANSTPPHTLNTATTTVDNHGLGELEMVPVETWTRQSILVPGSGNIRLRDSSDGTQNYYFNIRVQNLDVTMLTDPSLIQDVRIFEYPSMTEVPLDPAPLSAPWILWFSPFNFDNDGNGPNQPFPVPYSEVIGYLDIPIGDLSPGFYKGVVTDSEGHQHEVWLYHEAPVEVDKILGTSMNVTPNLGGSVTLSWTNPSFPPQDPAKPHIIRVYVETTEDTGDGFDDVLLLVNLPALLESYTIPATEVTRLNGFSGLHWYVQIRQLVLNVSNPDSSTKNYFIYRNYSPEQILTLP